MVDMTTTTPPALELVVRGPTSTRRAVLSPDGKTLEVTSTQQEKVRRLETSKGRTLKLNADYSLRLEDGESFVEEQGPYLYAELSPTAKFVATWSKPDKLVMRRFEVAEEKMQVVLEQEHVKTPTGTPLFQFTKDDQFVSYSSKNEIKVWDTTAQEDIVQCAQVKCENVRSYSLSPVSAGGLALLATFQPPGKASGTVALYHGGEQIAKTSLFRGEDCTFKWSVFAPGDVLARVEASEDKMGQSYYGESKLFALSLQNKRACTVLCGKEGAVHDFAWSPRRHAFVVIAGSSPALCTIYDSKTCDPTFQFGESHKNICCFSPSGRFLCLAGFGNLAGSMEFWDVKKNKLMGKGRADSAVGYGWAPNGRLFMTCTMKPRMNVDNCMTTYTYRGEKLATFRADKPGELLGSDGLLDCKFLIPDFTFPDLPASPRGEASVSKQQPTDAYRPPGAPASMKQPEDGMKQPKQGAGKVFTGNNKSKKKDEASGAPKPATATNTSTTSSSAPASEELDREKQLRKLRKLLRQIDEIEAKGATNPDQEAKIARKPEILAELQSLENVL